MEEIVAVLIPTKLIKPVCDILKSKDLLEGKVIEAREDDGPTTGRKLLVFTTLRNEVDADLDIASGANDEVLWMQLGLSHMKEELSLRVMGSKKSSLPQFWQKLHDSLVQFVLEQSPLPLQAGSSTVDHYTDDNENDDNIIRHQNVDKESLIKNIPVNFKYDLYPPLLLLPPSSPFFTSALWKNYISSLSDKQKNIFFSRLANLFKVTHIAINAPIPAKDNIIRRPLITPLYGNFNINNNDGNNYDDKTDDNNIIVNKSNDVFWVSTTQNGIYQTWVPLYTMFSRGNIREKTRILEKMTVDLDKDFTVVDLYVGIGYFTFSYLKGGAKWVLGWDINEWSIEGCRRGAVSNGWNAIVAVDKIPRWSPCRDTSLDRVQGTKQNDLLKGKDLKHEGGKLLLFNESNVHAPDRIQNMMGRIAPIRYINLGLLPTSRPSYTLAVQILLMNQPHRIGTVFVHENVGQNEIHSKAVEMVQIFNNLLIGHGGKGWVVECQHVEKVKSWAPGVYHCVFDIVFTPSGEEQ